MPTDQQLLVALYPNVDEAVAAGLTPQQLAMIYEGGGLEANPWIDPTDLLAAAGTKAITGAKGAGKVVVKQAEKRVGSMIDPSDPLGSVRHVLDHFEWNPQKMRTIAEHKQLEEAAGAALHPETHATIYTGDPKAIAELQKFERSMYRYNIFGQSTGILADAPDFLPAKKANKYVEKMKDLLAGMQKSREETIAAGRQTPMPQSLIKDLRSTLEAYENDLMTAGHK